MYLSVDLDYWTDHEGKNRSANIFFRKLFRTKKPIVIVQDHSWLVDDINKNPPKDNILYNVDYHSDILGEYELYEYKELTCGNWANFIKFKNKGHFVWVYPCTERCYTNKGGICYGRSSKLPKSPRTPFDDKSTSNWANISRRQGLHNVPIRKIERIGVSISPDYYTLGTVLTVLTALYGFKKECHKDYKSFVDDFMMCGLRNRTKKLIISQKRINQLAKEF